MFNFLFEEKNYKPMKNVGGFFALPALFVGLYSGFFPCALVTLLVFFIFLSLFCKDYKQVLILGLCFIISTLLTKFLLINNLFYLIFDNPTATKVYKALYMLISFAFIIIGFLSFLDWIMLKTQFKDVKFLIGYPAFLNCTNIEDQKFKKFYCYKGLNKKKSFKLLLLLAVFLGSIFTILESLWPQDYSFFIENFFIMTQGRDMLIQLRLFIYALFFTAPLWILWIGILKIMKSEAAIKKILNQVSIIKIIFSALCLSSGSIMIYLIQYHL